MTKKITIAGIKHLLLANFAMLLLPIHIFIVLTFNKIYIG